VAFGSLSVLFVEVEKELYSERKLDVTAQVLAECSGMPTPYH